MAEWTTLDLITSYTFNLPAPAPAEVPGFAKDGGKNVKRKDGKEKNVIPVPLLNTIPVNGGLVKQHHNHSRDAKRLRSRPAICGRRSRQWVRQIARHYQRPILVPPAKEEVLAVRTVNILNKPAARRAVLPKNRRLSSAEVISPRMTRIARMSGKQSPRRLGCGGWPKHSLFNGRQRR